MDEYFDFPIEICSFNSGVDCTEEHKSKHACHNCAWYIQWKYQQDVKYGEPLTGTEKPQKHLNKWFAWKANLQDNAAFFKTIAKTRPIKDDKR